MKIVERCVLALFGVIGLLAFVEAVNRYVEAHGWKPLAAGDWAQWVGAIGTVGALIGTIWIATAESRRRKREQKDLAVIAGASTYHLIGRMRNITKWVTDGTTSEGVVFSNDSFTFIADHLRRCEVWTNEETIQLVAAGNGIAIDLAICKKRFEWCISALDMAASMNEITPEQCKAALIPINQVLLALQFDIANINNRIAAFMPSDSGFQPV